VFSVKPVLTVRLSLTVSKYPCTEKEGGNDLRRSDTSYTNTVAQTEGNFQHFFDIDDIHPAVHELGGLEKFRVKPLAVKYTASHAALRSPGSARAAIPRGIGGNHP
jgi:hypothetical protein